MTQAQLHQSIARATGEDIDLISRRGFSLVDEAAPSTTDDWEDLALDWDQLQAEQLGDVTTSAA